MRLGTYMQYIPGQVVECSDIPLQSALQQRYMSPEESPLKCSLKQIHVTETYACVY